MNPCFADLRGHYDNQNRPLSVCQTLHIVSENRVRTALVVVLPMFNFVLDSSNRER
jgi:hypothetical protein